MYRNLINRLVKKSAQCWDTAEMALMGLARIVLMFYQMYDWPLRGDDVLLLVCLFTREVHFAKCCLL